MFVTPVYYTQDYLDAIKKPYQEWEVKTYPQFRAYLLSQIEYLKNIKTVSSYLKNNMFGTISGTLDPKDEQTGESFNNFVITVSCSPVSIEKPETLDIIGKSLYMADIEKSKFGNDLLNLINIEKSPITKIEIYASIYGFKLFSMSAELQAGVNEEKNLVHIVATEKKGSIYGGGSWFDGLKFILACSAVEEDEENFETLLEFPSSQKNSVVTIPLPNFTEVKNIKLSVRMEGIGRTKPKDGFGISIEPWEIQENRTVKGEYFTYAKGDTWGNRGGGDSIANIEKNPYSIALGINWEGISFMSRGVPNFYGKYPDHPIVTGNNIYPIISKSNSEKLNDLEEVTQYMRDNFIYIQETLFDSWSLMMVGGHSGGDCEDWAITAIQLLLERGWTIDDLTLEAKQRYEKDSDGYWVASIGHAWANAKIGGTVYAIGTGPIITQSAMREKYFGLGMYQIKGNLWKIHANSNMIFLVDESERNRQIIPIPYKKINQKMFEMIGTYKRKQYSGE